MVWFNPLTPSKGEQCLGWGWNMVCSNKYYGSSSNTVKQTLIHHAPPLKGAGGLSDQQEIEKEVLIKCESFESECLFEE